MANENLEKSQKEALEQYLEQLERSGKLIPRGVTPKSFEGGFF